MTATPNTGSPRTGQRIRFQLRDIFNALTLAAALLWLWLQPFWDIRERAYLAVWAIVFGCGLIFARRGGFARHVWSSLLVASVVAVVGFIDFGWYSPAPRIAIEVVGLTGVFLHGVILIGFACILALAVIYLDQLTSCFQRWSWWTTVDKGKWKRRFVVLCLGSSAAGGFFGVLWPFIPAVPKDKFVACAAWSLPMESRNFRATFHL